VPSRCSCSAVGGPETGDPEQGIALLEELILDNDPRDEELFGRAYNALGRCYMKLDKTTDALLAFLHTDVVFTSEPDVHAEALYHLGQLWSQVNQSERSLRARSLLNDRYSGTRWARR
jgi:tetratricopeptide (TPR) repeat protein